MGAYFKIMFYILTSGFKSQGRLAAENIALRHQVLCQPRLNILHYSGRSAFAEPLDCTSAEVAQAD
jgi:hypothetical protein